MIEDFAHEYKIVKDIFVTIMPPLIAFYLGQRGKLHLTKRAEFNALVKEIYFSLKDQIKFSPLSSISLNADEIALYIPFWRRHFYWKRVDEYKKYYNKISTYNPATGVVVKNEAQLQAQIEAAKKLLPYFKPR